MTVHPIHLDCTVDQPHDAPGVIRRTCGDTPDLFGSFLRVGPLPSRRSSIPSPLHPRPGTQVHPRRLLVGDDDVLSVSLRQHVIVKVEPRDIRSPPTCPVPLPPLVPTRTLRGPQYVGRELAENQQIASNLRFSQRNLLKFLEIERKIHFWRRRERKKVT